MRATETRCIEYCARLPSPPVRLPGPSHPGRVRPLTQEASQRTLFRSRVSPFGWAACPSRQLPLPVSHTEQGRPLSIGTRGTGSQKHTHTHAHHHTTIASSFDPHCVHLFHTRLLTRTKYLLHSWILLITTLCISQLTQFSYTSKCPTTREPEPSTL